MANQASHLDMVAEVERLPNGSAENPAPHLEMERLHLVDPLERLPDGSRAVVSGLQSRPELNGTLVAVVSWVEDKARFAVTLTGASSERLLVRPANLARCANPFERLPKECLVLVLSRLPTWKDAARAAAVCPLWNVKLRVGAWPVCASVDLEVPRGWLPGASLGSDWKEARPLAHPRAWMADPCLLPSWAWALRRFDDSEAACASFLTWVDRLERDWPGAGQPRWSGAARRLAWLQGMRAERPVRLWQLRGAIWRKFGGREGTHSSYRTYASDSTSAAPAPPCAFRLPADAALFFALFPEGIGELDCSEGWLEDRLFAGFEISMEPWALTSAFYARANNLNNLSHMEPRQLGCEPSKMLSIGHECLNTDFDSGDPSALAQTTLLLCCDEDSPRYGQTFRCETVLRPGGGIAGKLGWWQVSFTQLLGALLDALDEALDPATERGRRMAKDGISAPPREGARPGAWDRAWQAKYNVGALLRTRLDKAYTPVNSGLGGAGPRAGGGGGGRRG